MENGTRLEIKTKKGDSFTGILMPSSDPKIISLKLDSGYNIGLDKKNIKEIKEKAKEKEQEIKTKEEKTEINPKLKTITILHTGGTVASKVNYKTGAVAPGFNPQDILNMFPELGSIANIKSRLVKNMFSGDMRFSHHNLIAKEIEKEIRSGVDGIIVTHGTDTLAFTAAALTFALENLTRPVLLVGAQRSSDRPSSDAALNLICAVQFIAHTEFNEVGICMHANSADDACVILPSLRTKKLHSSRRDAFKSINTLSIAKVTREGKIEFLEQYHKKEHKEKLKLKLFNEKLKIGVLKAHPNLCKEEIKMFAKFDGLIIEGTGLGHISVNHIDELTKENALILKEITLLSKKIPVVMITQCIFGRVNMNIYQYGRELQKAGVLGNLNDLTFETAFIKLAWILSNVKKTEVREAMMKDVRGENSKRIVYEENNDVE